MEFDAAFYDDWSQGKWDAPYNYYDLAVEAGPQEAPAEVYDPAANSTLTTQTSADAELGAHNGYTQPTATPSYCELQDQASVEPTESDLDANLRFQLSFYNATHRSQPTTVGNEIKIPSQSHEPYQPWMTPSDGEQSQLTIQPLQQVIQHDSNQEQEVFQYDSIQEEQFVQGYSNQEQQAFQVDCNQEQQVFQQDGSEEQQFMPGHSGQEQQQFMQGYSNQEQQVIQGDSSQEQGASEPRTRQAKEARVLAHRTRRSRGGKSNKVPVERTVMTEDGQIQTIQQKVTPAVADTLASSTSMPPTKVKNPRRAGMVRGHRQRTYQPRCQVCNEKPDSCTCPKMQEI